jgi:LPXTG-motif cell wall-anchored protein
VVAIGRMFAGIRGCMVVVAGTSRFTFWKFLVADGLAAIVSGGFFVAVGYWLGQNLNEQNIRRFKHWFILGGIVLALGFSAWILWKRRHKEQVMAVEERVVAKVGGAQKKVADVVQHTAKHVVEHVKHPHPPKQPGEQQS